MLATTGVIGYLYTSCSCNKHYEKDSCELNGYKHMNPGDGGIFSFYPFLNIYIASQLFHLSHTYVAKGY